MPSKGRCFVLLCVDKSGQSLINLGAEIRVFLPGEKLRAFDYELTRNLSSIDPRSDFGPGRVIPGRMGGL